MEYDRENMTDTITNPYGGTISTDSMFSYDTSSFSFNKKYVSWSVLIVILVIIGVVYYKYYYNNGETDS